MVASTIRYSKSGSSASTAKRALPDSAFAPPVEAHENAVPLAKKARQIAPRRAGAGDPQHRLDEHPVVGAGPAGLLRLANAQLLDALPLPLLRTSHIFCAKTASSESAVLNHKSSPLGIP
jgi:hypothetical protein